MTKAGVFISFEGPDGSGKTTQIQRLATYFKERSVDVLLTREPGGTRIGEMIRELILDPKHVDMDPLTEAFLYAAARAQHVTESIEPALKQGRLVICDRFMDSSVIYQGVARKIGDSVQFINEIAVRGIMPDLTFLILVDPIEGKRRIMQGYQDRLEQEGDSFRQAVYEGYLRLAEENPARIHSIDGSRSIDDIQEEIRRKIEDFLHRRKNGLAK